MSYSNSLYLNYLTLKLSKHYFWHFLKMYICIQAATPVFGGSLVSQGATPPGPNLHPWTPRTLSPLSPPTNPLPDTGIIVPNLGVNFNCFLKINFIFFIFIEKCLRKFNRIKSFYFYISNFI